nr:MAG TPA: hypothetical protein [Caudoviricetes sp.]
MPRRRYCDARRFSACFFAARPRYGRRLTGESKNVIPPTKRRRARGGVERAAAGTGAARDGGRRAGVTLHLDEKSKLNDNQILMNG